MLSCMNFILWCVLYETIYSVCLLCFPSGIYIFGMDPIFTNDPLPIVNDLIQCPIAQNWSEYAKEKWKFHKISSHVWAGWVECWG